MIPLIRAMTDKDEGFKRYAVAALGEIGDNRAVKPLIQTLEHESSDVRKQATAKEALEKILKYDHSTGGLVFKHKGHKV